MPITTRCVTTYRENVIGSEEATAAYEYLRHNIQWHDGVRSRSGFTRRACSLEPGDDEVVDTLADIAVKSLAQFNYVFCGIYLNYYEDGNMYTPSHSHPGSHQIVISLGAERPLQVAKNTYTMKNGSAIIFGSATHGVPKFPAAGGGRISIALFLKPIPPVP